MHRLKEKGLWGVGLVPIRTPAMVKRYNGCLLDIGIKPTELKSFQIDGIGWSPQIAEEKGDDCYLSHGEANQFAILLSPDQEGKPIYAPAHSFDFELMAEVFRVARKQIANLTAETGLWLDIDQQIDHYHSPLDLLMLEGIRVKPTTIDRIIQAAVEQRQLVSQFREDNDLWMDGAARAKLIHSATVYGDLRYKPCIIPEIPFQNVANFYSRAFGGLFLFRDLPGLLGSSNLMILEDARRHDSIIDRHDWIFASRDVALYKYLIKRKLAIIDPEKFRADPQLLASLKENLLADALFRYGDNNYNLADATDAQKKRVARDLGPRLPEVYFEIDAFSKRLRDGEAKVSDLSKDLSRLLVRPREELTASLKQVVWMALMKLNPHSVEYLYQYSRLQFYSMYKGWPDERKRWALARLTALGLPNKN